MPTANDDLFNEETPTVGWGSNVRPFTDDEQRRFIRYTHTPSGKLKTEEVEDHTNLLYVRLMYESAKFRGELATDPQVQACLALRLDDMEAWTAELDGLAEAAPEEHLPASPGTDALLQSLRAKQNRMLRLAALLHKATVVHTRLDQVLDLLRDEWRGRSSQGSEWKVDGEFCGFEVVRQFR